MTVVDYCVRKAVELVTGEVGGLKAGRSVDALVGITDVLMVD